MADWQPTRWWRALNPDGKLWAESSDTEEIHAHARPRDRVQQLWERTDRAWADEGHTPQPVLRELPTTREELAEFFGDLRLPNGAGATGSFVELALKMIDEMRRDAIELLGGRDHLLSELHQARESDSEIGEVLRRTDDGYWCNCQAIEGTVNYPGPWHPRGDRTCTHSSHFKPGTVVLNRNTNEVKIVTEEGLWTREYYAPVPLPGGEANVGDLVRAQSTEGWHLGTLLPLPDSFDSVLAKTVAQLQHPDGTLFNVYRPSIELVESRNGGNKQ